MFSDILDFLSAWFLLRPVFGLLLLFMAIDVAMGLVLAWQDKRLSSDVSGRGMRKKVAMILMVLACEALGQLTAIPGPRELASILFCVNELISISKNAALLGAPLPGPYVAALIELQAMAQGRKQFRLGDSPQEHADIIAKRAAAAAAAAAGPPASSPPPDPLATALAALEEGDLP